MFGLFDDPNLRKKALESYRFAFLCLLVANFCGFR
jgi:hypothetical protein